MTFDEFIAAIEQSGVAHWMREWVKAMPIVEATHVLAAATVFGTVLVVDLRLLCIPHARRACTAVSAEMLRWTWGAFALAVVTGALMFAANAHTYVINTAFRLKLLALLAAGINMAIFQHVTFKGVAAWDKDGPTPRAARVAVLLSMALWIAVIFLARWIGFTKAYDFSVPADVQFDFGG